MSFYLSTGKHIYIFFPLPDRVPPLCNFFIDNFLAVWLAFFPTDSQLRFILKASLIRKTLVARASCCPGNSGRWKLLLGGGEVGAFELLIKLLIHEM